jgi:hypothetical protein
MGEKEKIGGEEYKNKEMKGKIRGVLMEISEKKSEKVVD